MQLRIHDLLLIAKYNPPEQAKHVIFVQFEQLAITFVMPENLIQENAWREVLMVQIVINVQPAAQQQNISKV